MKPLFPNGASDLFDKPEEPRNPKGFWYRDRGGVELWQEGEPEPRVIEGDQDFRYFDENGNEMHMPGEYLGTGNEDSKPEFRRDSGRIKDLNKKEEEKNAENILPRLKF